MTITMIGVASMKKGNYKAVKLRFKSENLSILTKFKIKMKRLLSGKMRI